jgi:hypothetical protein
MGEISEEALAFARGSYSELIEGLLDDPSDLLHPEEEEYPRDAIARYRKLGTDLGMDFDAEVARQSPDAGSYDRQRLAAIETGKLRKSEYPGSAAGRLLAGLPVAERSPDEETGAILRAGSDEGMSETFLSGVLNGRSRLEGASVVGALQSALSFGMDAVQLVEISKIAAIGARNRRKEDLAAAIDAFSAGIQTVAAQP